MSAVARRQRGQLRTELDHIGIDVVCEMLLSDLGYEAIAAKFRTTSSRISEWIHSDAERSARAREALRRSSITCDYKAETAILGLSSNATPGDIAKARELAQHYRWRAKVRNPHDYGEKPANVTVNTQGNTQINVSDGSVLNEINELFSSGKVIENGTPDDEKA